MTRFVRAPDVGWQVFDGKVVLVHTGSSRAVGLNRTASRIWEHLDGSPLTEVAARVAAGVPGATPSFPKDVEDFVSSLRARGLVEAID
jgi:hypothetical protein